MGLNKTIVDWILERAKHGATAMKLAGELKSSRYLHDDVVLKQVPDCEFVIVDAMIVLRACAAYHRAKTGGISFRDGAWHFLNALSSNFTDSTRAVVVIFDDSVFVPDMKEEEQRKRTETRIQSSDEEVVQICRGDAMIYDWSAFINNSKARSAMVAATMVNCRKHPEELNIPHGGHFIIEAPRYGAHRKFGSMVSHFRRVSRDSDTRTGGVSGVEVDLDAPWFSNRIGEGDLKQMRWAAMAVAGFKGYESLEREGPFRSILFATKDTDTIPIFIGHSRFVEALGLEDADKLWRAHLYQRLQPIKASVPSSASASGAATPSEHGTDSGSPSSRGKKEERVVYLNLLHDGLFSTYFHDMDTVRALRIPPKPRAPRRKKGEPAPPKPTAEEQRLEKKRREKLHEKTVVRILGRNTSNVKAAFESRVKLASRIAGKTEEDRDRKQYERMMFTFRSAFVLASMMGGTDFFQHTPFTGNNRGHIADFFVRQAFETGELYDEFRRAEWADSDLPVHIVFGSRLRTTLQHVARRVDVSKGSKNSKASTDKMFAPDGDQGRAIPHLDVLGWNASYWITEGFSTRCHSDAVDISKWTRWDQENTALLEQISKGEYSDPKEEQNSILFAYRNLLGDGAITHLDRRRSARKRGIVEPEAPGIMNEAGAAWGDALPEEEEKEHTTGSEVSRFFHREEGAADDGNIPPPLLEEEGMDPFNSMGFEYDGGIFYVTEKESQDSSILRKQVHKTAGERKRSSFSPESSTPDLSESGERGLVKRARNGTQNEAGPTTDASEEGDECYA